MIKPMITSTRGIELIKKYEGFESHPYLCPAYVPTIGYGATYYADGSKVTMQDEPITEHYADLMLRRMLKSYENGVNRYVQTEINQNQFDSLVSFAYNLGLGALKSSTLLKKININPNDPSIPDEFKRWVKAGGKVLKGLVKRREEEANLYIS